MNFILFDSDVRNSLLPLTFTRPVAEIRIGILTIREKWENLLNQTITTITEDYLTEKYPMVEMDENILLNSSFCPTFELVTLIKNLNEKEAIFKGEDVIAFHCKKGEKVNFDEYKHIEYDKKIIQIKNIWDIFSHNNKAIRLDFNLITQNRKSEPIPKGTNYINKENIFIEKGATISFATLNASKGPIYISKNSQIMEGSCIRGPLAVCENSIIKLGSKIYGPTTIGPFCKIAGEINNSVFFGYSNKSHDGYMGNSIIGEWCNIGAGTNCSNLKNNYNELKIWNYQINNFIKTGLQFCGLIMGDHSKCAINTMFNTATVVGVAANIFGSCFPRNFIPSFSWGGNNGFTEYKINKVNEVANHVMKRRNICYNKIDQKIIETVFTLTKKYRNY